MAGQEPEFASAGAVAGLAREVDGLRRAVDTLTELPARVDELAGLLTQVLNDLAASNSRPGPPVAPSWLDLDPGEVRAVLAELLDWMAAVYVRYPDAARSLPSCWLWHPDVVEELLWLQRAWHAAYRDANASVQLAGDWHDRLRPGVVRRIHTALRDCELSRHRPAHPRAVVPLGDVAAELVAEWWATGREHPAPEPSGELVAEADAYEHGNYGRPGGRR